MPENRGFVETGHFDDAESFHLNQCGKEAKRTVEKFHVRNAFAFERAIGAFGVTDVFTGELVSHR